MDQSLTQYRKLPGRLRGFGYGASVWMASDHLLLARTHMFREEYKRYYLRDIQSIVMAKRPRFIVTLPVGIFALLFLILGLPIGAGLIIGAAMAGIRILTFVLLAIAVPVAVWLYISAFHSCTCRISTAVSNDVLPSLYRTWTARRFFNEVRPWIEELQGQLATDWAQQLEQRKSGPTESGNESESLATITGQPVDGTAGGLATGESLPDPAPVARPPAVPNAPPGVVSLIFIASLFVAGAGNLVSLRFPLPARLMNGFILIELITAVAVMVQRQRGIIRNNLHRVALVKLISVGLLYYISIFSVSFHPALAATQPVLTSSALLRQISAGMSFLLAIIGVAILLRSSDGRHPAIMKT